MGREKAVRETAAVLAARNSVRTLVQLGMDTERLRRGKNPKLKEAAVRRMLATYTDEAGAWFQALAKRECPHGLH